MVVLLLDCEVDSLRMYPDVSSMCTFRLRRGRHYPGRPTARADLRRAATVAAAGEEGLR